MLSSIEDRLTRCRNRHICSSIPPPVSKMDVEIHMLRYGDTSPSSIHFWRVARFAINECLHISSIPYKFPQADAIPQSQAMLVPSNTLIGFEKCDEFQSIRPRGPRTCPRPLALPLRTCMRARSSLLLLLCILVIPCRSSRFLVLAFVFLAQCLGFKFVPVALEIFESNRWITISVDQPSR